MNKLMIVESPNKIKTLNVILKSLYPNEKWKVMATIGHFNDLSIGDGVEGLGIKDFESFEPIWKTDNKKKDNLRTIKGLLSNSSEVWVATDPDREGEGIASQFINHFKLKNYKRITFTELTDKKVKDAIDHPRPLNDKWVDAWSVRRRIDRLFGFRMSKPFSNFTDGKVVSIGRVQTPAVKIIVDRESEIVNFKPHEYKTFELILNEISFKLIKPSIKWMELTSEEFEKEISKLDKSTSEVIGVESNTVAVNPPIPLNTQNTLVLGIKLDLTADETQSVMQKLYEKGHITYLRTDSHTLDKEWVQEQRSVLKAKYSDLISDNKITSSSGAKNAQEGHEAIRPIDMSVELIEGGQKEKELYRAIWLHTMKCLLKPGQDIKKTVTLSNANMIFSKAFTTTKEIGWRKIANKADVAEDFEVNVKDVVNTKVEVIEKITKPPSRFNEGKFISEMERLGIGRPSTFASTVKLIKDRGYVELKSKMLVPTQIGTIAIKSADKFLGELSSIGYTSKLEEELDSITNDKVPMKYSIDLLKGFNEKLTSIKKRIHSKTQEINIEKYGACPKCSSALKSREGKYGDFLGCSNYPECKYTKLNNAKTQRAINLKSKSNSLANKLINKKKVN